MTPRKLKYELGCAGAALCAVSYASIRGSHDSRRGSENLLTASAAYTLSTCIEMWNRPVPGYGRSAHTGTTLLFPSWP
jgi:hypothetical protein